MMIRRIGLIVFLTLAAGFGASAGAAVRLDRDECRRLALESSERLARARNSAEMAEIERKAVRTSFFPRIEGSATGVYMAPDMEMNGMTMQMRGAYMAGLQLTQPVYAGGKIVAGQRLARIGREAAEEQLRLTRSEVIEQADNAYWTYVSVRAKVEMVEQFLAMIDTLAEQTSTALDAGMATEGDRMRVIARRSETDYQLQKARNGAELCRMALCNVIGLEADAAIEVSDSFPPAEFGSAGLTTDISRRPELRLLELGVEAKRQEVRLTRGDYLPTVGLALGYNYYGNFKMKGTAEVAEGVYMPYTQEFKNGIGIGMLSVKIPLIDWGEGVWKVRKARRAVENARLEQTENARLMELEARQAAMRVDEGRRLIEAAELALDAAGESLRIEQARTEESMGSLTELLDAQSQWVQARSNLIEARTQLEIDLTAWKRATGRL